MSSTAFKEMLASVKDLRCAMDNGNRISGVLQEMRTANTALAQQMEDVKQRLTAPDAFHNAALQRRYRLLMSIANRWDAEFKRRVDLINQATTLNIALSQSREECLVAMIDLILKDLEKPCLPAELFNDELDPALKKFLSNLSV